MQILSDPLYPTFFSKRVSRSMAQWAIAMPCPAHATNTSALWHGTNDTALLFTLLKVPLRVPKELKCLLHTVYRSKRQIHFNTYALMLALFQQMVTVLKVIYKTEMWPSPVHYNASHQRVVPLQSREMNTQNRAFHGLSITSAPLPLCEAMSPTRFNRKEC